MYMTPFKNSSLVFTLLLSCSFNVLGSDDQEQRLSSSGYEQGIKRKRECLDNEPLVNKRANKGSNLSQGISYYEQGDYKQALELFSKSKNYQSFFYRGQIFLLEENYDKAAGFFYQAARVGCESSLEELKLLASHHRKPYYYYMIGKILYYDNVEDEEGAASYFHKAISTEDQDLFSKAFQKLQEVEQDENEGEEGSFINLFLAPSYEAALQGNEESLKKIEYIASQFDNRNAQYYLGLYYKDKHQPDKAFQYFYEAAHDNHREAFEELKKLSKAHSKENPQYLYDVGHTLFLNQIEGEMESGARWLYKAIKYSPNNKEILGKAFEDLQILDEEDNDHEAKYYLKKMIEPYYDAACQSDNKALETLKSLADTFGSHDAQYYIGNIYKKKNKQEKAAFYFYKAALQGDQDAWDELLSTSVINNTVTQYYLGKLYLEQEEFEEAAHFLYKAACKKHKKSKNKLKEIVSDYSDSDAAYHLGLLYKRKGQYDKGARYFYKAAFQEDGEAFKKLEALADAHHSLAAHYYLGKLLYDNKEQRNAVKRFYKATKSDDEVLFWKALKKLEKTSRKHNIVEGMSYAGSIYQDKYKDSLDVNFLKKAIYWYNQAVANKHGGSQEKIDGLMQEECARINKIIETREGHLDLSVGRIALFRGIHYIKNLFDDEGKVLKHIDLKDIDSFLVSSAACELTGKKFLAGMPKERELRAGQYVYEIIQRFKSESEELYHKFHETYTNNHDYFHKLLEDPTKGINEITQRAFTEYRWVFQQIAAKEYPDTWQRAVLRNPFVSFSCTAHHGVKYAAGCKKFHGGEEVKLSPLFDEEGIPQNPYLGKVYMALLSAADLWKFSPTFVIDKHAQNKVEINTDYQNKILTEDEVSFWGYLPRGFIKESHVIEVSDLEDYEKEHYEDLNSNVRQKGGKVTDLVEETSKGLENRAEALVRSQNCLRIYPDIFENYYTSISSPAERFKASTWLHTLNAGHNIITSITKKGISGAQPASLSLLAINLTRHPYTLPQNWMSALRTIEFSYNSLAGTGDLFIKILDNPQISLKKLSLKSCNLTAADTSKIAKYLEKDSNLRTLYLDGNEVGEGAKDFEKSLNKNKTLKRLSLYNTAITDIDCFVNLFDQANRKTILNVRLIKLNLDHSFPSERLKMIENGLQKNKRARAEHRQKRALGKHKK
jgi:tetratricopeptide (TPR) repeat protein